jgi:hypothetical protein
MGRNSCHVKGMHTAKQNFEARSEVVPQSGHYTEAGLLGFSYDFGVTVIRHQNLTS